ncbi:MAG: ABC transporter permease subunit [Gemmatimonadaceae bacterium]|nr:ABC transporter permease subunit [Gemmatimonadaceae bacterium]
MRARDGRPARVVLVALAMAWSAAPLAMLALRARDAAWPWPTLVPQPAGRGAASPLVALLEPLATGVVLAVATALLVVPAAFALAWRIRRLPSHRQGAALLAAFLPVVLPPVTLGIGVQLMALRTGLAGTIAGVLLAHVVPALGYAVLALVAALRDDDGRAEETARTLGASWWTVVCRVTVRRHAGALLAAAALAALVSWGQVATTLLVGEGAVRTLAVEVLAVVRSGDDRRAAWAALLLTVPPLAVLLAVMRRRSIA